MHIQLRYCGRSRNSGKGPQSTQLQKSNIIWLDLIASGLEEESSTRHWGYMRSTEALPGETSVWQELTMLRQVMDKP